jgi:hypothetical protein
MESENTPETIALPPLSVPMALPLLNPAEFAGIRLAKRADQMCEPALVYFAA